MPRLKSSVPRYRRHKASGQAMVTLNGVDHYLGRFGTKTSEHEYDRLIGEWLVNGRQLHDDEIKSISITELCIDYTIRSKAYYRKNGKLTKEFENVKCVMKELRAVYGKMHATEFGPIRFKSFRERFVKRGLLRETINHYIRHVVSAFQLAVENEKIPVDIHNALRAVGSLKKGRCEAKEGEKIPPVERKVVEATLPFLPEIVADMVSLQLLTGMRPQEVCLVRPCDIDRSRDVWAYTPIAHKTEHKDKSRVVYIGPKGQTILSSYLDRTEDGFCFSPKESATRQRMKRTQNRVTPKSCGNNVGQNRRSNPRRQPSDCYSTASFRRAIHRACENASLEKWSPNQLRKATATEIRSNCDLEAAQVILGHASKSTTERWYASPNDKAAEAVMKEFG